MLTAWWFIMWNGNLVDFCLLAAVALVLNLLRWRFRGFSRLVWRIKVKFGTTEGTRATLRCANFTLIGTYLRIFGQKTLKMATFSHFVAPQGWLPCSFSVIFMQYMKAYLLYKVFQIWCLLVYKWGIYRQKTTMVQSHPKFSEPSSAETTDWIWKVFFCSVCLSCLGLTGLKFTRLKSYIVAVCWPILMML